MSKDRPTQHPNKMIFVGPSLSNQALIANRKCSSSLVFRPPIAQGDIYRLSHNWPAVIGIIDGVFGGIPSIRHKEILYAIEAGVKIYGAASMGALRACELRQFGMQGVGKAYHTFIKRRCLGDDYVAVLHAPQELGYQCLTVPLLELEETVRQLIRKKKLPPSLGAHLCRRASSMFFQERTLEQIVHQVRAKLENYSPDELERLLKQNWINQKTLDALRMIDAIHDDNHLRAHRVNAKQETYFALRSRNEATIYTSRKSAVRDVDLIRLARLCVPGIETAVRAVCSGNLKRLREKKPVNKRKQTLVDKFRHKRSLQDSAIFNSWLLRRRLSVEQVAEFLNKFSQVSDYDLSEPASVFGDYANELDILMHLKMNSSYVELMDWLVGIFEISETQHSINISWRAIVRSLAQVNGVRPATLNVLLSQRGILKKNYCLEYGRALARAHLKGGLTVPKFVSWDVPMRWISVDTCGCRFEHSIRKSPDHRI